MDWKVQLCELNYGIEESRSVSEVLKKEWLTMGEVSDNFEKEMQAYLQCPNQGVFVSSATAGLHLILMSLGVGPGDEVIIPGLTFISDANVIAQLGAKVVLADSISLLNFNVSEEAIIKKISSKTKAILLVHFAGYPCKFENLLDEASKLSIPIIEDCAHAPGAQLGTKMCGNLADFSFFSFFSNKNLAVGEGGMVFARCSENTESIRRMRSHGMTTVTLDRHKGRSFSYDVANIGLNYRADEIRGALGLEQLKKLASGNRKRKELVMQYHKNLSYSDITIPFEPCKEKAVSAYHIMPVILPVTCVRNLVMEKLKRAGIQTSIHYPPIHKFSFYQSQLSDVHIPVVDEICARELTLPLHPKMSLSDVDYVSDQLLGALQ